MLCRQLPVLLNCLVVAVWTSSFGLAVAGVTQESLKNPSAPIAITDVTVIDVVTGAHRSGVTVLIRDGKIEAIAPRISIPAEAIRLEGRGKFLIPGL